MEIIDFEVYLKKIQNLPSEIIFKIEGKNIFVNFLGARIPIIPFLPPNFLEILNSKTKILNNKALNDAKDFLKILLKDQRQIFYGIKKINSPIFPKSGKDWESYDKIMQLINLFLNNPLNSRKIIKLIKMQKKIEYFREIISFKENIFLRAIYFGYLEFLNDGGQLERFISYIEKSYSPLSNLSNVRMKIKRDGSHFQIVLMILKKILESKEKRLLLNIYANLDDRFDSSMILLFQELLLKFMQENKKSIENFFSSINVKINIDILISKYIEMLNTSSEKFGVDFDRQSTELKQIFILFLQSIFNIELNIFLDNFNIPKNLENLAKINEGLHNLHSTIKFRKGLPLKKCLINVILSGYSSYLLYQTSNKKEYEFKQYGPNLDNLAENMKNNSSSANPSIQNFINEWLESTKQFYEISELQESKKTILIGFTKEFINSFHNRFTNFEDISTKKLQQKIPLKNISSTPNLWINFFNPQSNRRIKKRSNSACLFNSFDILFEIDSRYYDLNKKENFHSMNLPNSQGKFNNKPKENFMKAYNTKDKIDFKSLKPPEKNNIEIAEPIDPNFQNHFSEFFKTFIHKFKVELIINPSNCETPPNQFEAPYKIPNKLIGSVEFKKWINKPEKDTQIFRCTTKNMCDLILKRKVLNISSIVSSMTNPSNGIRLFIYQALREFFIGRLISFHDVCVEFLSHNFTFLAKQNILVSEITMNDDGQPLSEKLKDNSWINTGEAINILSQTACGLACLQEFGIYHSDIKPENILITIEGKVKIIDFDISSASFLDFELMGEKRKNSKRSIYGYTLNYASPEIINSLDKNNKVDPNKKIDNEKSDSYSFGIVALVTLRIITIEELKEIRKNPICEITNKFIMKIENMDLNCEYIINEKIKLILLSCLQELPENRLSLNSISNLFNIIRKKHSIQDFKQLIIDYAKNDLTNSDGKLQEKRMNDNYNENLKSNIYDKVEEISKKLISNEFQNEFLGKDLDLDINYSNIHFSNPNLKLQLQNHYLIHYQQKEILKTEDIKNVIQSSPELKDSKGRKTKNEKSFNDFEQNMMQLESKSTHILSKNKTNLNTDYSNYEEDKKISQVNRNFNALSLDDPQKKLPEIRSQEKLLKSYLDLVIEVDAKDEMQSKVFESKVEMKESNNPLQENPQKHIKSNEAVFFNSFLTQRQLSTKDDNLGKNKELEIRSKQKEFNFPIIENRNIEEKNVTKAKDKGLGILISKHYKNKVAKEMANSKDDTNFGLIINKVKSTLPHISFNMPGKINKQNFRNNNKLILTPRLSSIASKPNISFYKNSQNSPQYQKEDANQKCLSELEMTNFDYSPSHSNFSLVNNFQNSVDNLHRFSNFNKNNKHIPQNSNISRNESMNNSNESPKNKIQLIPHGIQIYYKEDNASLTDNTNANNFNFQFLNKRKKFTSGV